MIRPSTRGLPLGRTDEPEPLPAIRDPGRRAQALTALAGLTITRLHDWPADASPRGTALELRRLARLARGLASVLDAEADTLPDDEGSH